DRLPCDEGGKDGIGDGQDGRRADAGPGPEHEVAAADVDEGPVGVLDAAVVAGVVHAGRNGGQPQDAGLLQLGGGDADPLSGGGAVECAGGGQLEGGGQTDGQRAQPPVGGRGGDGGGAGPG